MSTAIAYTELGGPEVLATIDIEVPAPGPGEVALRVEAVGVNPLDLKLRAGLRPSPPITEPRRIGSDAAGIVTAVGDGVEGYRPGDAVIVAGARGAYATDLVVPVAQVVRRPEKVSAAQGAALGIPIGTAYQTVHSLAIGPEDTVLVHAACARDDHGIAGSVPLDAVADGGDDARGIRPDAPRLGDGRRRAQPRPQLQVEGVHPDRLDAEGDLARVGRGHLDVDRGEDLRPSEFGVRDGGAHGGAHTTSRAISPARRRPS